MSIDELRKNVYEIRALLHLYDQCRNSDDEVKITKHELLKLLVETRKKVNQLAK